MRVKIISKNTVEIEAQHKAEVDIFQERREHHPHHHHHHYHHPLTRAQAQELVSFLKMIPVPRFYIINIKKNTHANKVHIITPCNDDEIQMCAASPHHICIIFIHRKKNCERETKRESSNGIDVYMYTVEKIEIKIIYIHTLYYSIFKKTHTHIH